MRRKTISNLDHNSCKGNIGVMREGIRDIFLSICKLFFILVVDCLLPSDCHKLPKDFAT